ncbi:EAL domain-containing protein [Chitinimonas arctica]|uniref:EAL domain-containing protein n=1 Tax=Chitinimonas arctica TaxID=2594795 RepID=A0A516SF55_9NEIS|nr:EAL domain-containing protein [Chitinimonas arctica]QDQ26772.1 EAL domain-containing protein [Chitinimonas arctica]
MSLLRQLWLVVLLSTLLAFLGGFAVNLASARQYLEQQLMAQSADSAASLALSMSQQSKDLATTELLVSALFDSGHFRMIRFEDVHGRVRVERRNDADSARVPAWFSRLMPLHVEAGTGMVSDGWNQAGKVVLVAHERFAYESLWLGARNFLLVMALTGMLSAMAVFALIRWVRRPLSQLMVQADAIGKRNFITIAEPNVTELRRVVRSMNLMVDRVKAMFAEQAARIEDLRGAANRDALTGLPNRDHFLGRLRQTLADEGAAARGALLLIRLHDLLGINRSLGRAEADGYIRRVGAQLQAGLPAGQDWLLARLNGADFAVLAQDADVAQAEASALGLLQALQDIALEGHTEARNIAHIGVAFYQRGSNEGSLLSAADQALARAEAQGGNQYALGEIETVQGVGLQEWREILDRALAYRSFEMASFPVLDLHKQLIHHEVLLRLQPKEGELLTAGQFMPMAGRFGYLGQLDLVAIELACERLKRQSEPLAVNISSASISDEAFLASLPPLLARYREVASLLWFEVNEYGLGGDYQRLVTFSTIVREFGSKVGIEHFGRQFGRIPALYDLRLDYLKIDGSFIRDIDQQDGNQMLLKAIIGVADGAGLLVLAEAVHTEAEWQTLCRLGTQGMTGPLATRQYGLG